MQKQSLCLLFVVAICCLASGCASVNVTKTAKGFYDPTRADDVDVIMTRPDRRYTELATISTQNWPPGNTAKMHNALRAKSSELGAHAVILTNSGIDPNGYLWSTGVAIRYD